jgi:hypothetical protein
MPTQPTGEGLDEHLTRLAEVAAVPTVATRIDAIGTIFGDWSTGTCVPGFSV